MSELPKGWANIKIDEITEYNPKHPKDISDATPVSFVPMTVIAENSANIGQHNQRPLGQIRKGYTHFADGDVVIAKITPCFENGKAAIASNLSNGIGCGTTELHVLRPSGAILKEYLYHYVHREQFRKEAKTQMTGTAGQLRVPSDYLKNIEIPLAPLNEQKRIVAKLDELLPKVEACKERLQKIPTILKRFRQSVLAAAVSGKLTEEWRNRNNDIETGQALINRVLNVRSGSTRKVRKSSLEELGIISDSEELNVPQSWAVVHPETLLSPAPYSLGIGPFGSNLKVSDYTSYGVPLVFVRHIRANDFDGLGAKFVTQKKADELEAHSVEPLDLVITKMGEPPGDCEIYPKDRPRAILTADCLKFRIWREYFDLSFYKHCINSTLVKDQLGLITKGVAQQKISVERFRTIKLPVPPLEEQREIARMVGILFEKMNDIWLRYEKALQMLSRTEASVLTMAFSGTLVSQDPTDEPASALLERIKQSSAQNNNGAVKPKSGKRGRKGKEVRVNKGGSKSVAATTA